MPPPPQPMSLKFAICVHWIKQVFLGPIGSPVVALSVCMSVIINYVLGGGGVQGQAKGQWLMSIFADIDYIWLATCQSKIYKN